LGCTRTRFGRAQGLPAPALLLPGQGKLGLSSLGLSSLWLSGLARGLQLYLNEFFRLVAQVFGCVRYGWTPDGHTGFHDFFLRRAVGKSEPLVAVGERNRHKCGMAVHGAFLVRPRLPMQDAYLCILELNFAMLGIDFGGVLGEGRRGK